jgi:hypothetical protein
MSFDQNVIEALAWLRKGWDGDNSERAITAFETLDNAGVFAALDEQTDYASAEEILAESARMSLERRFPNTADPAEWGDTTTADMARHQGLVTCACGAPVGDECICTPADEHEHAFWNGHPDEMCMNEYCTLTYAQYWEQLQQRLTGR